MILALEIRILTIGPEYQTTILLKTTLTIFIKFQ
jgi:hypothetical protein